MATADTKDTDTQDNFNLEIHRVKERVWTFYQGWRESCRKIHAISYIFRICHPIALKRVNIVVCRIIEHARTALSVLAVHQGFETNLLDQELLFWITCF